MLTPATFARRRQRLASLVSTPVLLMGTGRRARNLPMNEVTFRQDSTFWYFTGCELPDAAALLMDGRCTLFLPPPAADDALWHGTVHTLDELRERYGVDEVRSLEALADAVRGLSPATLAIGDETRNRFVTKLTGDELQFGTQLGDADLVRAVIALRRTKDADEIAEHRRAADATAAAHLATMRGTRPGGHENGLTAVFEAVLAMQGCTTGYDTILTQRGEVLHNHAHDGRLEAGRLLLLDGGAELRDTGYGADVTRTWPVSGQFSGRQRAAYEAVLAANLASIAACEVGVRYRHVHDTASLVLAAWLREEGLLTCSPETAVETGAHAVFFPHGVGHLLGMDVHDLEAFGDLPAYPPGQGRPEQFGTRYLRLDLPLEAGWVVTIEPGFYVVPAILADRQLREQLGGLVDWERAASWLGFGGIRIEDDIVVHDGGPEVLTQAIPKTVAAVEAEVGQGPTPEERLR